MTEGLPRGNIETVALECSMVRQQRIVGENILFTYLPKRGWAEEDIHHDSTLSPALAWQAGPRWGPQMIVGRTPGPGTRSELPEEAWQHCFLERV